MKHIYLFTILVFSSLFAKAQIVNIPDANFKAYLLANTTINTDADKLNISVQEATAVYDLAIVGKNITSLVGVEAFVNIVSLWCENNQIKNLDASHNVKLVEFSCHNNQLTGVLDISKLSNLGYFHAESNPLLNTICVYSVSGANSSMFVKDATASWSETCSNTTSLEDNTQSESISLYPNPAKDIITMAEGNTLALYNTAGVLVLQANTSIVNLASLQAGVYCAKITDADGKTIFEKWIKE